MTILQFVLIYMIIGVLAMWHYNPLGILKQEAEKDIKLRMNPDTVKLIGYLLIIFVGILWPLYLVTCAGFAIARKFK